MSRRTKDATGGWRPAMPSRVFGVALSLAVLGTGCSSASTSLNPGTPAPSVAGPARSATPSSSPTLPTTSPTVESPSPTATQSQPALGAIPTKTFAPAATAALQGVLSDVVAGGAPDAIAAVITEDGTWAGAAGIGGPDGRAATPRDEFAIASITKTFTAAVVMRLVEQGKMDLDAPLASYLGDLKLDANHATVRQALAMRAGIVADDDQVLKEIYDDPSRAWTAADVAAGFGAPAFPAGSQYLYSNPTYETLAFAVEHVTGMSFPAAVRTQLLDPVRIDRILDQGRDSKPPKPWALPLPAYMAGHDPAAFGEGGALPSLASGTHSVGGASMAADATSLAAWGWHLFAGDIVSAASLAVMTTVDPDGHGLGLDRFSDYGDLLAYGHSGAKTGYGSILVVLPERQAVVVLFVNDPDFVVEPVVGRLLQAAGVH
jgi:D-alanyl-D-alanine carboxypeptidase